jgi:hypothetical protein
MARQAITRLRRQGLREDELLLAALEELQDDAGHVSPVALELAARSPEHPCHERFEWDNAKAGYQHRLDQARSLIASVRVVVRTETQVVRAIGYIHDDRLGRTAPGYIAVTKLRTQADASRELLIAEIGKVEALVGRVLTLAASLSLDDLARERLGALLGEVSDDGEPPQAIAI